MTKLFWTFFEMKLFGPKEDEAHGGKNLTEELLQHMSADELPEWYEHSEGESGGGQLEETTKMAEARLFDGVAESATGCTIFDRL